MTDYTKKFKENKKFKEKNFKENTTMSLKVKDKQLFKNYSKIWGKN